MNGLLEEIPEDQGTITGYKPGTGKYEGKCGALIVTSSQGVEFSIAVGLSDDMRANPPAIGEKIIYKYADLYNGRPRFPRLDRICPEEIMERED